MPSDILETCVERITTAAHGEGRSNAGSVAFIRAGMRALFGRSIDVPATLPDREQIAWRAGASFGRAEQRALVQR